MSTEAERQRGPCSEPLVTGISPEVRKELPKLTPSIRERIEAEIRKKAG
jgi:hypothetical protein